MNCPVCNEETEVNPFCQSHAAAFENLRNAFHNWTIGYGPMQVEDFLSRLEKLPMTGQKTKEIARFFLANPSRWK